MGSSAPPAAAPPAGLLGRAPQTLRADLEQPVSFAADRVEYDRERDVLTAEGRVEAWQGGRILRADRFVYDRARGTTRLSGHVQLIEPDGQVIFAEEAELAGDLRDGTLSGIAALIGPTGRLTAAGARRSADPAEPSAAVTDMARVTYSACEACPREPTRPPLWQVRARLATQDQPAQRITYRDAVLDVGGVPILWLPWFSHPDPQAPRASGFLFPTAGTTRFLGPFVQIPFYWVIDPHSDLTATLLLSSRQAPNLGIEYRRRFNAGEVQFQASAGYFTGVDTGGREEFSGHIFSRARFAIDANWRAGLEINRATSELYLRTYRFEFRRVLTSQAYLEGFWGSEGYARLDTRFYQGLRFSDANSLLPIVGPNLYAEWSPARPFLGGRFYGDAGTLGISREAGSYAQRLTARLGWERRDVDGFGNLWTWRIQADARSTYGVAQQKEPVFQPLANGLNAGGNIRAALDWRLPLVRDAGRFGQQTIEPRIQFVTGPNMGRQDRFPNEDSIDFEFTDANLFALNRFPGRDRQEGGTRFDFALRGAWNFPNGGQVEALAGRSWRVRRDQTFAPGSGLERNWSDWVGRVSLSPTPWLDLTVRTRLDGAGQHRFSDVLGSFTLPHTGPRNRLTLHAGYIYTTPQPFLTPLLPRNEVVGGFSAARRVGDGGQWRIAASARYDVQAQRPALIQAAAGYEDECLIVEGRFIRRFAIDPFLGTGLAGNSILLFRIGLKTIGDVGFRAL
ncbi:MAG: LPS assembly protein LptD [Rhodovarius sp.]|nr:LPS assembly protein LptD [Rhodovarius sp.]MCX7933539.1 LPS assembly protein LptD [Rhodovarius sp.]MDW8313691.1 LPS assembly protein LptD [Rhodovarius sp.]